MTKKTIQTPAVEINSEIGILEGVILHSPGPEVENMTPNMVQKALYSDILNLQVATAEYKQLKGVLDKYAKTYQVKELLSDVLVRENVKNDLVQRVCDHEDADEIRNSLLELPAADLATALIEGVELTRDNLSKFLSSDRYALKPLHNFFYTRDASIAIGNQVFISKMACKVRARESMIMESIFQNHPVLSTGTVNPMQKRNYGADFHFEGGDFLVASDNILVVGTGMRTTPKAIDYLIEKYKKIQEARHIIVQELPYEPESFIHLDMVFTFLDRDVCMIYEPLIMHSSRYLTIQISLHEGKVKICEKPNIPTALRELGLPVSTINCGGSRDVVTQEREQWHSGANFFAIAPGKVIGYGRNNYTVEEMSKHGFAVLKDKDVISGKTALQSYEKCVITIEGSELSRGGGGCRCMTMPFKRRAVKW